MRKILLLFIIVAVIGLGYGLINFRTVGESASSNNKSSEPASVDKEKEKKLLDVSKKVMKALELADYDTLETLISSSGLSFSHYADALDLAKNNVNKESVSDIATNETINFYGHTDGKGDPINMTTIGYIDTFIYNRDYMAAPKIVINKLAHDSGNTPNHINKYSAGRDYVGFHFDGFNPKYEGMDWTTLYLIYDIEGGKYFLRGIVKDNWTI